MKTNKSYINPTSVQDNNLRNIINHVQKTPDEKTLNLFADFIVMMIRKPHETPASLKLIELLIRYLDDGDIYFSDADEQGEMWKAASAPLRDDIESIKKYSAIYSHTSESLADYCASVLMHWDFNNDNSDTIYFLYQIIITNAYWKNDMPPAQFRENLCDIAVELDRALLENMKLTSFREEQ